MKVSLITIKGLYNYGAVLQAYATFVQLQKMGYDVEVIDYYPDYFESDTSLLKQVAIQIITIYKRYKINKFATSKMRFTDKTYRNFEELKNAKLNSDFYVVGSDQVWNRQLSQGKLDPVYFLDFTDSDNKIAFSSSIGRTDVAIDELKEMKNYLKKFSYISVREESAKQLLESVGVQKVVNVIDPVFLLTKEDYKRLIKPVKYDKYLLIYSFERNETTQKLAKEIAGKLGLQIIEIGIFKSKYNCDKYIHNAGIEDFLSLMYYADFIITSSFHGTAFSILLNKQFVSVAPSIRKTRLENITNIMGLSERLITEISKYQLDDLLKTIEYENINKLVDTNAEKGIDFLKEAITNKSKK